MAYIPSQKIDIGLFVPTTDIYEVGILEKIDPSSPQFKELIVRLSLNLNRISLALNLKESAYYVEEEFITSQLYFNPISTDPQNLRSGFRKIINIGALPAGVTSINHGLVPTADWKFTKIYGAASDTLNFLYYPLPDVNLAVNVTPLQVVINNTTGVVFTDAYVILEYVKN
jgi:hypothetical protein